MIKMFEEGFDMLKDRLTSARKAAKRTQKDVAETVGMTQSNYSQLETGRANSSVFLPAIADYLGVSALWLQTGEGLMHSENNEGYRSDELKKFVNSLDMLDAANKLPPELVAMLQNTLNTVVNIQDNQDKMAAGQDPAMKKPA
jgi:transcriptional regulator with XRE-family HTH domain